MFKAFSHNLLESAGIFFYLRSLMRLLNKSLRIMVESISPVQLLHKDGMYQGWYVWGTHSKLVRNPTEHDDDDSDVDLFGEETEEEKKAAEERAKGCQSLGKRKDVTGKSSILLDVNPWDDETYMARLEETMRSVHMEGLTWGMMGYGIKKLQIMMIIVDDLVSIDSIIGFWLIGL
ncbi:hypothetical protein MKW92_036348 [Papaver armeniacum]|nr:hypothetical protein MKW92_036348 [Papaver armeniacum]